MFQSNWIVQHVNLLSQWSIYLFQSINQQLVYQQQPKKLIKLTERSNLNCILKLTSRRSA